MPHFMPRKIRLRKTSAKSGHEISIPPDWVRYHNLGDSKGETLELLYDSIIVVVPPGIKVNKEILATAVEEETKKMTQKTRQNNKKESE